MNNRQFAILVSITFFVGMIWLISDILFNTKASIPISPKLESALEEVNPNFNTRVLDIITKETLGQDQVNVDQSIRSTEPSIIPTEPIIESSGSAAPAETQPSI